MFPTCHGRNLLKTDDAAPLRRPRKAEGASTKKENSTTCLAPGKTEDVPSSNGRETGSVRVAKNPEEVSLRRPRKAETASTNKENSATCPVPQKSEGVPTCDFRKTESGSVCVARKLEEVSLRRPRKAEAASKKENSATSPVPQKIEDVATCTSKKTESGPVSVELKEVEVPAPVSTKTAAVSSPPPVPTLPLCTSEEVSGLDKTTLLLLRELLSRVQYSADEEEAQEHIYNLYCHLKVYGKMLDGSCKGEVDSVFVVLRDLGRDSGLAYLSRLLLLELVELRAAGWNASPHLHSYYTSKLEKFPDIKYDDLPAPSNTSAVASLLSCLTTPKGFSPREPVESRKEEKKKSCQEAITVCKSLAVKVFESTEKIRRLEERCRAELECYPDADGEDCLVKITAENQEVIDHAVTVIEEAIAEVEHQTWQDRQRRRLSEIYHKPRRENIESTWHRPRGSTASWETLQYSSYQDKIAARDRYNGGTQGNGTHVSAASPEEKNTFQKPVREETTTTFVFSHRPKQSIIPARPAPEPVPVYTPTVSRVHDDLDLSVNENQDDGEETFKLARTLDWDDIDDNSDLFVWRAHKTLASEVNRLAAVKEPNVGFDHQKEVPCGKIKTKKMNQNPVSPTEKQNSSTNTEVVHRDKIPANTSNNSYDNTANTCKPDNVASFSGGTPPIPKSVVHQSSDTSQTFTEKASSETLHKERTPSSECNSSFANTEDSSKHEDNLNSFSGKVGDTSQLTTPLSNGVKHTEKKTSETMWAGWVDENTRSPMELSDNVVVGETAFFSELAPSFVEGNMQNHDSASQERDSPPLSDSSSASLVPDKYQESVPEHIAHLEGEWNEDDIYYSDEDDLLDDLCENCCPQTLSPESPDVAIEEEVYSPRSACSHTGLVTIKEESDTGEENNNGSSICEDTVNNNNNNNKSDATETTGDICSCSKVVEDVVDVNNRCSPTSVQVSCEKAGAADVSSSSRIAEEEQGVRSTEASSAEKPVSPRTLLAARPQFFKLPRFLVNTIRQPINPLYHQTVLDRAWGVSNGQAPHKNTGPEQRRFLFAQTAKLYYVQKRH